MHSRIVDHILDLVDASPTDAPDAFRWTFEVARPVISFLRRASSRDVERLRSAVERGRISVTAGYLNMTQLPSEIEFDDAYDLLDEIRAAGIPVCTEQHGDVNGIAWGAVAGMKRHGVDRLLMALNPDHGRAPLEQPSGFWWEAPGGQRVFAWLSTHYGFGEEWGVIDGNGDEAERQILEYIARLDERDDYQFETAIVHAGNDNRWPTTDFLSIVRLWNERHPDIPMRTATVDEALDDLEHSPAAADLPVLRGEWADWWSHGHGSTAREVAVYREARSLELGAQAALAVTELLGDGDPQLATVLGYRRGPVRTRSRDEIVQEFRAVDESIQLFDEHTWGSWETYSKPHSTFSHSHWNAKAAFAYEAYDFARDLALEGLFRVAVAGPGAVEPSEGILVFNPTHRPRTEPVTCELKVGTNGVRMATVVARDVPPYGTAVLSVPELSAPRVGRAIENDRYRVEVDPAVGVTSIVDRKTGRELVDAAAGWGLATVVVDRVATGSTHPMVTTNPKAFQPETPGPDFVSTSAVGVDEPIVISSPDFDEIRWSSSAPTVPTIETTLRIYRDLDVIDVDVWMVKPEVFAPESIFVAFPFAADSPEFLLETAGAVFAADSEQLPDTSKDWYSLQHSLGVTDAGGSGILFTAQDAPLVQVGGIHTGLWARDLDASTGHVNSWIANNLHFTNFQARQEATGHYRYRFASRPDGVTRTDVRHAGRDALQALLVREYAGPRAAVEPVVTIEPADCVLAELRQTDDGARLRVRNITDAEVAITVTPASGVTVTGDIHTIAAQDAVDIALHAD